jgi:preprotein translocase subunit SecG
MMWEQLTLIIHVLVALAILALIMLQQGKGAEAGASFGGGASQTVLGVAGSGNLLTRWTSILAAVFFCNQLNISLFC